MTTPPQNPGSFSSAFDGGPSYAAQHQRDVHFVLQNRYEVVSMLGQGGMGTVYMARDLRLANRYCVVKKLRDDFFREEDKQKAKTFFEREAMVLSQLQHPNIVHILDYFQEDDDYYFVMEYVEGENLHQMLTKRGEPFAEEQVLQWASQITDVLQFLHSNEPKVIYRDLKPSNIMIDTKDRVKLVDFGIARPYEETDNTHVVSAGYSPPEQYWGAADPRSDIYALGATMYFLLTGQEPLALQTSYPRKINPEVSERTDLIVQRATQQDMWLRQQNAEEMKGELDGREEKESARVKLVEAAAIVVLAVAVAGVGAWATIKFSTGHKQASEKGIEVNQAELLKKDKEIEQLKANQGRMDKKLAELTLAELKRLQAYRNSKSNASPGQSAVSKAIASDVVPASSNPKHPAAQNAGAKPIGVAFKESDEAQLTDPEGLAPLEEDSQSRNPRFSLFGGGH